MKTAVLKEPLSHSARSALAGTDHVHSFRGIDSSGLTIRMLVLIISAFLLWDQAALASENSSPSRKRGATKALTYDNIVSHLKDAGLRTTEVQKRCSIFFEGEWKNANVYNYALIIVENSDEDVQITFYVTDAHEMNWLTEFLDAPFFAESETQQLFALVNAHAPTQRSNIGRYQVEFHHWEPKHADIFVFSFGRR